MDSRPVVYLSPLHLLPTLSRVIPHVSKCLVTFGVVRVEDGCCSFVKNQLERIALVLGTILKHVTLVATKDIRRVPSDICTAA